METLHGEGGRLTESSIDFFRLTTTLHLSSSACKSFCLRRMTTPNS